MSIDWRNLDPQTAEKIRRDYLHIERTKAQLQKDLVTAFDSIHDLKCKLRGFKTRIWALSGALAGLAGLSGWLASHLYDCMTTVHQVMR